MIDAHVHLWRIGENGCTWPPPSLELIYRDFSLDDWRAEATGVQGCVLVQSQENVADTAWLLSLAERDRSVLAVVGWTDVFAPDAADAVADLACHPKLRGLRPMVQDRAANWYDDFALDPVWHAMTRAGLVLDALIRPPHLPSLHRLAERHPALTIVVDHGAKPVLSDLARWRADLAMLARRPRTWCKLSGLLTERGPDDPPEAIESAVAALVALFGPDRLLWGSDWPVLRLHGDYRSWHDQARALVPMEQHGAVFEGAARAAYGIAA